MSGWSPIGLLVLGSNFPLNVFVTISNKAFFRVLEFRWPVTLAAVHMLFCALIPFVMMRSGLSSERPPSELSLLQKKREWLLAFVWALHIAMSNIGLRSVSVHLFVVVKCAGPVASALLSWLIMGRKTSPKSLLALSLLVAGPALAGWSNSFVEKLFVLKKKKKKKFIPKLMQPHLVSLQLWLSCY